MPRPASAGFTIVEFLVVIVAIGILAVIAIGAISNAQANVWVRLSTTFTSSRTVSSFSVTGRVNNLGGTTDGFSFDVADCMLTKGSVLYRFYDGDSAGWTWSGSVGGSPSSGPAWPQ